MTNYEEYLKARRDDELADLFRLYIYSGLVKTKELGHLPLLIQNKLDMLNKEFKRRTKDVSNV